jgi:class 3 adenylate cyclase
LLTAAAREAISSAPLPLHAFGPTLLPGFEEPVGVFELPWRDLPA